MAYSTGTALRPAAVMTALDSFLTGAGWTLHDTVTSYDKVYFSDGILSDQNMYIRVRQPPRYLDYDAQTGNFTVGLVVTGTTSGATATIVADSDAGTTGTLTLVDIAGVFLDNENITDSSTGAAVVERKLRFESGPPHSVDNCLNWLNISSYTYWDNALHTGVNETGRLGPMLSYPTSNSPTGASDYVYRPNLRSLPQTLFRLNTFKDYLGNWSVVANLPYQLNNYNEYGARVGIQSSGTVLSSDNVSAGQQGRFMHTALRSLKDHDLTTIAGSSTTNSWMVPYWDRSNDQYSALYYQNSTTLANWAGLFNFHTDGATLTSSPPFSALTGLSANAVWDGEDLIYVAHGTSYLSFAKYKISTNAWTALTNAPSMSTLAVQNTAYTPLYIPRGTITGVTEDEIWFLGSTTVGTAIYRYSVTSNSWATLAAFQAPVNSYTTMTWDGSRYVYHKSTQGIAYGGVLDLQNIGAGWTSTTIDDKLAYAGPRALQPMLHYVSRIRVSPLVNTTYHIVGDKDGVTVVTTYDSKNWVAGFGKFSTLNSTAFTNVTSSATAGNSTIPVTSSAAFAVGDLVNIVDRATGSTQSVVISDIPTATSIQAILPEAIGITSYITGDGANCVLYGDSFYAVTQMGPGGFEPDSMAMYYDLRPTVNEEDILAITTPGIGRKQLWPLELSQSVSTLANFGRRGRILNMYICGGDDGDIITDSDGNQYLVVESEALKIFTDRALTRLAVGPIN